METEMIEDNPVVYPKRKTHYYMLPAILVTLFCFWPTGIVSILKVVNIEDARLSGDALYLRKSKRDARKWMYISIGFGVVVVSMLFTVIGLQLFYL